MVQCGGTSGKPAGRGARCAAHFPLLLPFQCSGSPLLPLPPLQGWHKQWVSAQAEVQGSTGVHNARPTCTHMLQILLVVRVGHQEEGGPLLGKGAGDGSANAPRGTRKQAALALEQRHGAVAVCEGWRLEW